MLYAMSSSYRDLRGKCKLWEFEDGFIRRLESALDTVREFRSVPVPSGTKARTELGMSYTGTLTSHFRVTGDSSEQRILCNTHTRDIRYLAARLDVSPEQVEAFLRTFHNAVKTTLTSYASVQSVVQERPRNKSTDKPIPQTSSQLEAGISSLLTPTRPHSAPAYAGPNNKIAEFDAWQAQVLKPVLTRVAGTLSRHDGIYARVATLKNGMELVISGEVVQSVTDSGTTNIRFSVTGTFSGDRHQVKLSTSGIKWEYAHQLGTSLSGQGAMNHKPGIYDLASRWPDSELHVKILEDVSAILQ
ncbi:hypothetical protein GCM10008955_37830 [Deinococcus malanensis]|uniref:Uncharacterized protein n=1 Tax=Deinococcus malanensis TaxID=1706855 RepID=A0ABQ2F4L4_9DEIO|nr:hypothetical protein GCM10008955_37830 [Deinococcus malanensis]